MPADLEILAALRNAPKRSKAIAGYRADAEQTRAPHRPGPPVTAPPARRCAGCGRRDGWVWDEPRPGGGRGVCGVSMTPLQRPLSSDPRCNAVRRQAVDRDVKLQRPLSSDPRCNWFGITCQLDT